MTLDLGRLDLPAERAKKRLPIDRTYAGTNAEPRGRLRITMRYNDVDGRWNFAVELVGRGMVIPRQPAMLWHGYTFRDRYIFQFVDPYRDRERVTPQNLADPVYLACIPGPGSPGYAEWRADLLSEFVDVDDSTSSSDGEHPPLLY